MKRSRKIALLTCFTTALGMGVASAHVEFNPDTVKANVNQVVVLSVPHDCSASTKTTLVKFQLPTSIDARTFKAVGVYQHGKLLSSWHEKLTRAGGRYYLAVSGPAITTGPDGGKNAADIKFKLTPTGAKGSQLKFPAVQYCTNGASVNWIQPRPADGSDPAESATPVPVLNLN
jgi:periplasmic copper chaperone A